MSPHDDEFPASASANAAVDYALIGKVPFGIDKTVLAGELRQLADAIDEGSVFPQRFERTQRDLIDDFKMFTLAVTFAAPKLDEDSHPKTGERS